MIDVLFLIEVLDSEVVFIGSLVVSYFDVVSFSLLYETEGR